MNDSGIPIGNEKIVKTPLPSKYYKEAKKWKSKGGRWQLMQFTMAIAATITAIGIATFTEQLSAPALKSISALNAVLVSLLAMFNFSERAIGFRNGLRDLQKLIMRYEADPNLTLLEFHLQYEAIEEKLPNAEYRSPLPAARS
jgi:hypothetical protein